MTPRYREDKATQAAAHLLACSGGHMNHMKLIKLLYLAEREAVIRWGRPITYDTLVSMPHGPVLSLTLNNINGESDETSYWHRYISQRSKNRVRLLNSTYPNDALSEAEEQLLSEIFEQFGQMNQWQLREYTHDHLPEWEDPSGSSFRIEYRDILKAAGLSDEDADEIELELREVSAIERLG